MIGEPTLLSFLSYILPILSAAAMSRSGGNIRSIPTSSKPSIRIKGVGIKRVPFGSTICRFPYIIFSGQCERCVLPEPPGRRRNRHRAPPLAAMFAH